MALQRTLVCLSLLLLVCASLTEGAKSSVKRNPNDKGDRFFGAQRTNETVTWFGDIAHLGSPQSLSISDFPSLFSPASSESSLPGIHTRKSPKSTSTSSQKEDETKERFHFVLLEEGRIRYSSAMTREVRAEKRKETLARQTAFKTRAEAMLGRELRVPYHYTATLNGFVAALTQAEVSLLRADSEVHSVFPADRILRPTTWESTKIIRAQEFWELGGSTRRGVETPSNSRRGEGVVVGLLDSGIFPEHPSFSDEGMPEAPWKICQQPAHGSTDAPYECNNKLIGAQYFLELYNITFPNEHVSFSVRENGDTHGTHTASTAAGNSGVQATIAGLDGGKITGVAPRSWVAMYRVCGFSGCVEGDMAAAIDKAVADGVDVLSISLGGGATSDPFHDSSLNLLAAMEAGVVTAVSAGNEGPGFATVGAPALAPWVTAVGATFNRKRFAPPGRITLKCGSAMTLSFPATGGLSGVSFEDAPVYAPSNWCSAPPSKPLAPGTVIICPLVYGSIAALSAAARQFGAAGALYMATNGWSQFYDYTAAIPYASINWFSPDGDDVDACVAQARREGANITISFAKSEITYSEDTVLNNEGKDTLAGFSSRGPVVLGGEEVFDWAKPDLVAPGVNIIAAWDPEDQGFAGGDKFISLQGTSMSCPHVGGAFALLKADHPDWTPANIRGALMSTAKLPVDVLVDSFAYIEPGTIFDRGSGMIDLVAATQVGLLFDHSAEDFVTMPMREVNLASIHFGSITSTASALRTLRSVRSVASTWDISAQLTLGSGCASVSLSSNSVTVAPGESFTLNVTLDVSSPECGWLDYVEGVVRLVERGNSEADGSVIHITFVSLKVHLVPEPLSGLNNMPGQFGNAVPMTFSLSEDSSDSMTILPYPNGLSWVPPTPMQYFMDPEYEWEFKSLQEVAAVAFALPKAGSYVYVHVESEDVHGEHPDTDVALFLPLSERIAAMSQVHGSSNESFSTWLRGPDTFAYLVLIYNEPPIGHNRLPVRIVIKSTDDEAQSLPFTASRYELESKLSWNSASIPAGETGYGVVLLGSSFASSPGFQFINFFLATVDGGDIPMSLTPNRFPSKRKSTATLTIDASVSDKITNISVALYGLNVEPTEGAAIETAFSEEHNATLTTLTWTVASAAQPPFVYSFAPTPEDGLEGTIFSAEVRAYQADGRYASKSFSYKIACAIVDPCPEPTPCPEDDDDDDDHHHHHPPASHAEFNFIFSGMIPAEKRRGH